MILTWIVCSGVAGTFAIVSAIVVYGIIHRTPKNTKCTTCKHLKWKGGGHAWKYCCDAQGSFDKEPEYCRDYAPKEAEQ